MRAKTNTVKYVFRLHPELRRMVDAAAVHEGITTGTFVGQCINEELHEYSKMPFAPLEKPLIDQFYPARAAGRRRTAAEIAEQGRVVVPQVCVYLKPEQDAAFRAACAEWGYPIGKALTDLLVRFFREADTSLYGIEQLPDEEEFAFELDFEDDA